MYNGDKLCSLLEKLDGVSFNKEIGGVKYSFENPLLEAVFKGDKDKMIYYKDMKNSMGYIFECTPLILACQSGDTKLARILIRNGVNVNQSGYIYEMTPLILACVKNKFDVISELIGNNIDEIGMSYEISPLTIACINGNEELVDLLINSEGIDVNKEIEIKSGAALAFACEKGCKDIVELLIKEGANTNENVEILYENALSAVVDRGYTRLERLLLNCKARVSKKAEYYGTPLKIALEKENFELVNCLEKHKYINSGRMSTL